MDKLDEITWSKEELELLHTIGNWYGNVVEARGQEAPDHILRALLHLSAETYHSNKRFDEMAEVSEQAQLDEETVASLTAKPATAEELAAVCGVLASTLGANSGIVNEDDLHHHRVRTVKSVLAQIRLKRTTEHMSSGYVQ